MVALQYGPKSGRPSSQKVTAITATNDRLSSEGLVQALIRLSDYVAAPCATLLYLFPI
jgi:ribonuclease HI